MRLHLLFFFFVLSTRYTHLSVLSSPLSNCSTSKSSGRGGLLLLLVLLGQGDEDDLAVGDAELFAVAQLEHLGRGGGGDGRRRRAHHRVGRGDAEDLGALQELGLRRGAGGAGLQHADHALRGRRRRRGARRRRGGGVVGRGEHAGGAHGRGAG